MASLSNIFASIDQARGLYDNISGTLSRDGLSTDSDESDETLPPTQVVAADEYDDGVRIDVDARDIAFENVTGDEVDQWYEPEEPALIRTPDGVELLRTTRASTCAPTACARAATATFSRSSAAATAACTTSTRRESARASRSKSAV